MQSLDVWYMAVRRGAAHPFTMMFLIPCSHKNCIQEREQIRLQYLHCNTVFSVRTSGHVLCHTCRYLMRASSSTRKHLSKGVTMAITGPSTLNLAILEVQRRSSRPSATAECAAVLVPEQA